MGDGDETGFMRKYVGGVGVVCHHEEGIRIVFDARPFQAQGQASQLVQHLGAVVTNSKRFNICIMHTARHGIPSTCHVQQMQGYMSTLVHAIRHEWRQNEWLQWGLNFRGLDFLGVG